MNTTNFFTQLAQLDFTGNLQLTIAKGTENNLIVSVLLNNDGCGDKAKNCIPPLILNATPQEFDEGFFQQISKPIQKISGLMIDMEDYLKKLENVKKQSAMEKDKTDKQKKQLSDKDKIIADALKKVDELEKEGQFRKAWSAVPEPNEYPERAEELLKRRSSLTAKFAPDLFGQLSEPKEPERQVTPQNVAESQNESYAVVSDSFGNENEEEQEY